MKFKLVDEWRSAWKWISVNSMAAALAVQVTWANIPDDMKRTIPADYVFYLTAALLGLGIVGRLTKQGGA